jgi:hypothetical protein
MALILVCAPASIHSASSSLDDQWHCELIPVSHIPSLLRGSTDDTEGDGGLDLLKEKIRFQDCIARMFERQGKGVIFMETALHSGVSSDEGSSSTRRISKHHTVIDVLPFEDGMQGELEMFFKQVYS